MCKVADHIGAGVYFNTLVPVDGQVGTRAAASRNHSLSRAAVPVHSCMPALKGSDLGADTVTSIALGACMPVAGVMLCLVDAALISSLTFLTTPADGEVWCSQYASLSAGPKQLEPAVCQRQASEASNRPGQPSRS